MSLSDQDIKAELRRQAFALGFAEFRIAPVEGPAAHAEAFQQWIDAGLHGDMAWLARNPHRRKDPREVLPGVKSMVVVAMNYLPPEIAPVPWKAATGIISRYAWGYDYHDVMEAKLRQLCVTLTEFGGVQKPYVDTGPVLEKDWATTAGLGWNGKSTIQIHEKLGAWFFLGEILTTLDLPPDAPVADRCGSCIRCITACPTGAIDRPRHVDAPRCISYLTIEHKGSIPLQWRRAIGTRIYGCDDCLAVCPWNRFAEASREAAFAAREFVAQPLREFLALTDEQFRVLFRGNPIKRIKRPAFLRNVCVALGNAGTADDLPTLQLAALDSHPLIAEHAAWAIEEIQERLRAAGG
ncbi:MAG: tRNA epoxyqueuosine(34) reductase QueG [Verrucomicrobiales bacterium]|nr:tRNA epoxyqueuosine(34) reductase QueG [Verrucomicrobiales bacterium]